MIKKICKYCQKEFYTDVRTARYCSSECREKAHQGICKVCGKPTKNGRSTCSEECLAIYRSEFNAFKREDVKEKIKETNLTKYGVENPQQNAQIRSKTMETVKERYGRDFALDVEKASNTMLERYGVRHALQSQVFRDKVKETNSKTGKTGHFHSPEWDEAMIEKYGTTVPYRNDSIKNRGIQTLLNNYGVTSPAKLDWVQEKTKSTCLRKYGVEYSFQSDVVKNKSNETCLKKYGKTFFEVAHSHHRTSKLNEKLQEYFGIPNDDCEVYVGGKFYDFRVGGILVEINPTVTHNSDRSILFSDGTPIDKDYHINKTLIAESNGYRCVHVWDWDDIGKIKNILRNDKKIVYARDCEVVNIDKETSDIFLDNYHTQNHCHGDAIRLGIIFDGSLVGVMTFGAPRYNNSCQVELLRLCYSDCIVIGGTNKLFTYFINNYKPDSIVSYCDRSKFMGNVYESLGFTLKTVGNPSAHWVNISTKKHILDSLLRQRGYDQLFGTNFGKGSSNEQLMLDNGFVRVYDCGQNTYVWGK